MATSEQLEREAEATRAQIAATLDELRSRLTTGQMVDQLVDYARDSGGGEFVRNLGRQVVGNPLPVTLVGAGLAWLMMAGRRAGANGAGDGLAMRSEFGHAGARVGERTAEAADSLQNVGRAVRETASETLSDARDTASETWSGLRNSASDTLSDMNERIGEAGADMRETANAAGSAFRDAASTAYDATAERSRQGADALARGARSMRDSATAGGRNVMTFLQEQPLVLAGLGLAIGALLGTSLPSTEVEDKLMGDASDAAKRDAKILAEEQLDKGKAVAEQAWNAAKPEIDEQLHGGAQHPGAPGGETRVTHEPAGEATLVPLDETGQAEMAT